MNTRWTPLLAALLVGGALAGCIGGSGPLAADFTATSSDKKTYTFDASASGGAPDQFLWDFGDGGTGEGKVAEHTYEFVNGEYDVTLTVVGGDGTKRTVTKSVMTGTQPNQEPMLMVSADQRWVRPDEEVLFDARGTHDMDGDPIALAWDFNYNLKPEEIELLLNLGRQSYAESGGNMSGGGENASMQGEPRSLSPPTEQELQEARQRFHDLLSQRPPVSSKPTPRHGGGEGGPAYSITYNEGFDGRINDTSPMQFFSWPEAGTYAVKVSVRDIKGDVVEGFMAIKVSSDAPSVRQSETVDGAVEYVGPGLESIVGASAPKNYWRGQVSFPYPGQISVSVALTQETSGELMMYVCKKVTAVATWADCEDRAVITAGPDAESLSGGPYTLTEKDPANNFLVYVVGESETPSGADITLNMTAEKMFDTNPWWDVESPHAPADVH